MVSLLSVVSIIDNRNGKGSTTDMFNEDCGKPREHKVHSKRSLVVWWKSVTPETRVLKSVRGRNVSRESRWRSNISSWCLFVILKVRLRLVGNCFGGCLEVLLFHFTPACCRLRTATVNAQGLYHPHQKFSIDYGTVP